jgi:hypothetical protein
MLLRDDVLRTQVIWREEMAGLEQVTSRHFNRTHRQKELVGGFSVFWWKFGRTQTEGIRRTEIVGNGERKWERQWVYLK